MLFLTLELLLLLGMKDAVSWKAAETSELIKARLGEMLVLDCTYNCSSGFERGYWKWEDKPACGSCLWKSEYSLSEDMCTVRLTTQNLTLEQTLYNYSCVSEKNDDQNLPLKTERMISLQIQDKAEAQVTPNTLPLDVSMKVVIVRNEENDPAEVESLHLIKVSVGTKLELKCLSTDKHCEGHWMKDEVSLPKEYTGSLLQWDEITEDDGGSYICYAKQLCSSQKTTVIIEINKNEEFVWIKALAAIALSAVVLLILLLIYLYYKRTCIVADSDDLSEAIYENTRPKSEAIVVKPIVQDCQSDHEVPYADIMISVRGSSIPELTGIHSQAPRDHRPRWREEAAGGSRLHACRSADRLHVHPREVSRKLSTTSEYAIITYSTEGLS